MAVMVKTYVLLCVVGLFTTLFVILIMYGDNHPHKPIPSKIRMAKPASNSTRHMTFDHNKFLPAISTTTEDDNKNDDNPNTAISEQQEREIWGVNEQFVSQRISHDNNKNEELVGDLRNILATSKAYSDVSKQIVDKNSIGAHVISKEIKDINDTVTKYPSQKQWKEHVNALHSKMSDEFNKKTIANAQFIQAVNAQVAGAHFNIQPDVKPVLTKPDLPIPVAVKDNIMQPAADHYIRSCKPLDDIALLKTHKCSSSTLQNILYRWGDAKNLSFVLPKGGMPYLGNPAPFDKKFAIESADGFYNILANHARFSEKGMAAILSPDTTYVTILRNPTTQYESLYTYYRHQTRYGVDLSRFLSNPSGYFHKEPFSTHIVGRNSMLFDLGLDARYLKGTDGKINSWIRMLDRKFKLVLIAEYFAESLILLKDLLCWSMDDIIFLNQNARSASSVKKLTPMMQQDILKWNSGDAKLYDHFNRTLWRKIETYGIDRMKKDVELLRMKNEAFTRDCVQSTLKSGDPRMWYPPGVKMESFKVNPFAKNKELCDRLTRPELTYMKLLADKQRRRNSVIMSSNGIHKVRKRDVPEDGPQQYVPYHGNGPAKLHKIKPYEMLGRNPHSRRNSRVPKRYSYL